MNSPATPGDDPRHPIQIVARRTGLSTDLLRAWERRYEAVRPARSRSGRRLYTDGDIDRLQLLRRVTEAGRSISRVANLDDEALQRLAEEDEAAAADHFAQARTRVTETGWVGSAMSAVEQMDDVRLRLVLSEAELELNRSALIDSVILPLLISVGDRWREGSLRVAHEHLASTIVRSFLTSPGPRTATGPTIVIGTPSGHFHEMGAMMATSTALDEGWNGVYMGPDLPAEELAAAAVQLGARAVGLSLIHPPHEVRVSRELERIRRLVPERVAVVVGGRVAGTYATLLSDLGVALVADLTAFRSYLEALRVPVGTRPLS